MKSLKIGRDKFELKKLTKGVVSLIPLKENTSSALIAQCIQSKKPKGILEVIGTNHDLTIFYKGKFKNIGKQLARLKPKSKQSKTWKIAVCFEGGHDWNRIEEETKISKKVYLKKLMKQKISVSMFGFIPGFVYLSGLEDRLQVSRKRIPVYNSIHHAVAIGGSYIGIYNLPSPAGWNIIGKIPSSVANTSNKKKVQFGIHDEIRFYPIDSAKFDELNKMETINES